MEIMPKLPPCFGIIPARYASTRFEGKPLADILGRPMFHHVYKRAVRCPLFSKVVLATDDTRIYAEAARYQVPVVMTGTHESGTDRVLEAAGILSIPEDAVVANIQGDEPLLEPEMLTQLLEPFADPEILVTTLATKISPKEAESPDQVKVVWSKKGLALYFSRALIPHPRAGDKNSFWGHIGLYAFRMGALRRFAALGPSELETRESLEQLRFLENDIPVHVVPTSFKTTSVDRPEDLKRVIAALSKKH